MHRKKWRGIKIKFNLWLLRADIKAEWVFFQSSGQYYYLLHHSFNKKAVKIKEDESYAVCSKNRSDPAAGNFVPELKNSE